MDKFQLITPPPNGCYSIANNRITGELLLTSSQGKGSIFNRLSKSKNKYGFRGSLDINRNGQIDQITFFDYSKEIESGASTIPIDFEFPCHDLYLPSSINYTDPRLRLSISIKYEVYTLKSKLEVKYQGKNLENTFVDSELIWNDLGIGETKIGVKKFVNLFLPIGSQIQLITEKAKLMKLHFRLDSEILVNIMRRRTLSYQSEPICVIDWSMDQNKSILEICKNPIWCDCSILDLLQTSSQLIIGCEFNSIDEIIWVSTRSTFDFLVEERLPPGYNGGEQIIETKSSDVIEEDKLPNYDDSVDPPEYKY